MTETSRMEQFDADIADMRIKTGRSRQEGMLLVASIVLMAGGIVLAFGAYLSSLDVQATPGSNVDVLDSNSYLPLAVTGLAISVVGGFVFLRCSLARFLRFWLLRQSYEQQLAIAAVVAQPAGTSATTS